MNEASSFHRERADVSSAAGGASVWTTTPGQDVLRALLRTDGVMRRLFDAHLSRFGLTVCQWGVLRALARHEATGLPPMRIHELGGATFVQPPSMSATLARMEKQELITRTTDPDDSRSRRVHLSPTGREAMERALPEHQVWMARVTGVLTQEECVQLRDLLNRLADFMTGLEAGRAGNVNELELPAGERGHVADSTSS
ncbi:MAG: MarR family transcriptional regulator [Phycisphaerales bacterium]